MLRRENRMTNRTLPGPYYCLHCKGVVQQGQQVIVSIQRIDERGYYIPGTPLAHFACAVRALAKEDRQDEVAG